MHVGVILNLSQNICFEEILIILIILNVPIRL